MTMHETLVKDLATLCSNSGTKEAIGHIVAFCHSSLFRVLAGDSSSGASTGSKAPGSDQQTSSSETDTTDLDFNESILLMLDELTEVVDFSVPEVQNGTGGGGSVDPRLFSRMLKKVVQLERGVALARAIGNMPFFGDPSSSTKEDKGSKKTSTSRSSDSKGNSISSDKTNLTAVETISSLLPSFLRYTVRDGRLQSSLVLLKLLLTFIEDGFDASADAVSVTLETMQRLERCTMLGTDIWELLPKVVNAKHAVEKSPKILLTSGKPAVQRPLKVEGPCVGFIGGVCARVGEGVGRCVYYEATVLGDPSVVSLGWARARGILTGGDEAEVWLFDCSTRSFGADKSKGSCDDAASIGECSGSKVADSYSDSAPLLGGGSSSSEDDVGAAVVGSSSSSSSFGEDDFAFRSSEHFGYLMALVESGVGVEDLEEEMADQQVPVEDRRAVLDALAHFAAAGRAEAKEASANTTANSSSSTNVPNGSILSCILDTQSCALKVFIDGALVASSTERQEELIREALSSPGGACPYFVCGGAGGVEFNVGKSAFAFLDSCLAERASKGTEGGERVSPVLSLFRSSFLRFTEGSCLRAGAFSAHRLQGIACDITVRVEVPSRPPDANGVANGTPFTLFSCCVADELKINWIIYNVSVDYTGRIIFDCDRDIRLETVPGAVMLDGWRHLQVSFLPTAGSALGALPLLLVDGQPAPLVLVRGRIDSGDGSLVSLVKASVGRRLLSTCEPDAVSESSLDVDLCSLRVWSSSRSAAGGQLLCNFCFLEGSGGGTLDGVLVDGCVRANVGEVCSGFSDASWGVREEASSYKVAAAFLLTNEHGVVSRGFTDGFVGVGSKYPSPAPVFAIDAAQKTVSVSLGQILFKLSRKLFTIADNWIGALGVSGLARTLQGYSKVQSVIDANANTFSLIQSLLQQLHRLGAAAPSASSELLPVISASLSRVLEANFHHAVSSSIPLATLGLQWIREQKKCLVATLLSSLCHLLSGHGAARRSDARATSRSCAVRAVIAGVDFFFPGGATKLFVTSCLLTRRDAVQESLPRPSSMPRLLLAMRTDAGSGTLEAVLAMSAEAQQMLLRALLHHLAKPSQLSRIVNSLFRPTADSSKNDSNSNKNESSSSSSQPAEQVYMSGCDVCPLVGDTVERGAGWNYGDQDGGVGSRGVVTGVSPWHSDEGPPSLALRISVVWLSNGHCNSYRWGVSSAEGRAAYDLQLLRPARSPAAADVDSHSNSSDNSPAPEQLKTLQYTPQEVQSALVEHTGELSKRAVLEYMKGLATSSWLDKNGLSKSVNSLVNRLRGDAVSALYADFYSRFSAGKKQRQPPLSPPSHSSAMTLCDHLSNIHYLLVSDTSVMSGSIEHREDLPDSSAAGPAFGDLAVRFLCSLQALLTGVRSADSCGDGCLEVVPLDARLATRSFAAGGARFRWVWADGCWTACGGDDVIPETDLEGDASRGRSVSDSSDAGARGLPDITDITFDADYAPPSVSLSDRGRAARQTADRQWNTLIATTPLYPNTGTYKWYTRIDKLSGLSAMLGVVSEDYCSELFIGQDEQGWGVSAQRELYHAGERLRTDFGCGFQMGDIVEVTVDTDGGAMLVANSRYPDSGRQVAFDDVEELPLYPAWTFHSAGDAMSISTEAAFKKACGARSAAPSTVFAGTPHPLLLHMCNHSISAAAFVLAGAPQSISCPLVSTLAPQLLASLHLWHKPSTYETRRLSAGLTALQKTVWECIDRLRCGVASALSSDAAPSVVDELQSQYDLAVQLCTLLASYTGVVVGGCMEAPTRTQVDNHLVAMEALSDARTRGPAALLSTRAPATPTRDWLKSDLFSQGMRAAMVGDNTFLAAMVEPFSGGAAAALVKWLAENDSTHPVHRRLGGEHLAQCVRLLFTAILYHSGFLHCAASVAAALVAAGMENTARPPAFLTACWTHAMKLRMECSREVSLHSTSYEAVAGRCEAKIRLLFELEQCRPDQIIDADYSGSVTLADYVAAFDRLLLLSVPLLQQQVAETGSLALALTMDESSTAHLRASLAAATASAAQRVDALKTLRSTLGRFPDDFGWGAKCALLSRCAFGAVSDMLRDPKSTGAISHHNSGLEGSSRLLKQELRGAFDSLYAHLTDELVRSTTVGEGPLQLLLLGALGVVVHEGDHTLLARVNIFHALQEILESSIATGPPAAEIGQAITKAAVKLFILLALQVATSGADGSNSAISTRTISSSRSLDSNSIRRVRSGPATLSSAVFEILFSQISMILSMVKSTAASSDALVVLTEATTLLVVVSQDSSCQRTLRSPRWVLLLLDVISSAPTVCQRNALLALQCVLPSVDLQQLHSSHPLFAALCASAVPPDVASPTVAQYIVYFVLDLCHEHAVLGRSADPSCSDSSHFSAEVVCLLRMLASLPGWRRVMDAVIVAVFNGALTARLHERSSQLALAGLCVLGGHICSLYVGCHAFIVESDGQEIACVVTSLVGDSVEVQLEDSRVDSCTEERTRSVNASCLRPTSKMPLDELRLSADIVLAAVQLARPLLLDATEEGDDPLLRSVARATYLRAVSELAAHPWSADIIQRFVCQSRNGDNRSMIGSLLSAVLDTSVSVSKSCGLSDTVMLEEAVVRGVSRRRHGTEEDAAAAAAAAASAETKPKRSEQKDQQEVEDEEGDEEGEEEDGEDEEGNEEEGGDSMLFLREWGGSSGVEDSADGGVLVEMLSSMGFPRSLCLHALESCGFDFDDALNYILSGGEGAGDSVSPPQSPPPAAEVSSLISGRSEASIDPPPAPTAQATPDKASKAPPSTLAPRSYYYSSRRFLPIHSLPSNASDRIGAVFPGDEIASYGESVDESGCTWLKVRLEEFLDDEDYLPGEATLACASPAAKEGDGSVLGLGGDEFAWVPRLVGGITVVKPGPSPHCGSAADGLPSDSQRDRSLYRVVGFGGAIVRAGVELSSDEVGIVLLDQTVVCVEECFSSQGKLRLRIEQPIAGWVSKQPGLLCKLPSSESTLCDEGSWPPPQLDHSAEASLTAELELLQQIDDELEQRGGHDIYRRDERYFNSLQGSQYQRCPTDRGAAMGMQRRRTALLSAPGGTEGRGELLQRVQGLCVLYARKLLLALLYRCSYCLLNPATIAAGEAALNPAELVGFIGDPASADLEDIVASKLTPFLRLTLFRGSPRTAYGFEGLAFDPLYPLSLPGSRASSDMILGPAVLHILSSTTQQRIPQALRLRLLSCLAYDVRTASGAAYNEQSWGDPSYHEEQDAEALKRPNIHFCMWISRLLHHAHANDDGLNSPLFSLLRIWCCALRAASTSLKQFACVILSEMITASGSTLLPLCLQLLPLQRLRELCSRRVWYEMEDHPIYSRFLQAAVHLLAIIDDQKSRSAASSIERGLGSGSGSELEELGGMPFADRPLLLFESGRAHIQLSPQRDLQGSWTVEAWLLLDAEGRVQRTPLSSPSRGAVEGLATPRLSSASYLLASSGGYIKLRCGGRLYGPLQEDSSESSLAVNERALCVCVGQKGSAEQVFDAVLPTGRWIHLAISCSSPTGGAAARVALYVDGTLADAIAAKVNLPLATLGSTRHGQSFYGRLAELRVWSHVRSAGELKRGMHEDVTGSPGLIGFMRFSEATGDLAFDSAGLMNNCKLSGTRWVIGTGPVASARSVPRFMRGEQEEGDEGSPAALRELTGSLRVQQVPGVTGEFAADSSEVVTVCFGASLGGVDGVVEEGGVEGYIDWSERGVRSSISGVYNGSTGSLSFTTSVDRVFLGPPEALHFLRLMTFDGCVQGSAMRGSIRIDADLCCSPLRSGEVRVDKLALHGVYDFKDEVAMLLAVSEGMPTASEGMPITVAYLPPMRTIDEKQEHESREPYGLCEGEGCLWVEWRVIIAAAGVTAGACGSSLLQAAVSVAIVPATAGDIVGVCVDSDRRYVSIFCNGAAVMVAALPDALISRTGGGGIRPFISMRCAGDGAEFLGERSGQSTFAYGAADPLFRGRFDGNVLSGRFDGVCSFQGSGEGSFWYGRWSAAGREGLHLKCSSWLDDGGEVLSAAEFVADKVVAEHALNSEGGLCVEGAPGASLASTFAELRASLGTALRDCGKESDDAMLQAAASHEAEILSLQENIKRLYKAASTACVTFSLRDPAGVEMHFKVSVNVRLQKVFDVYAAKRGTPVSSLHFFFEGEPISGESSPESLDLREGDIVLVRIITTRASDEIAVKSLMDGSANFVIEIIYANGATVRNGIEIEESSSVRMLRCGDIIEAFERGSTREGIVRYRTADGWISERLRGGGEERIALILRERFQDPPSYRVVRAKGAKLRAGPLLTSQERGYIPLGTDISVSERQLDRSGSSHTPRLRIATPVQFADCWISDKESIVEAAAGAADLEAQSEIKRRAAVRAHRIARAAEETPAGGPQVPLGVTLTGSMELSSDTLFLLTPTLTSSRQASADKLSISEDFRTVSCRGLGLERQMVYGSRGFTRGIHYWEVAVDSASYGSVFIGVAPAESRNWNGYGIINYRATQAFGSERIYGSYFGSPDTIGVLLDMDHGTISFFKEGADFMLQKVTVLNMGVAYRNLRRNARSSSAASPLFPCFGLKSPGDQLSLRHCKWLSNKGLESSSALARIISAKQLIGSWPSSYGAAPPAAALQRGLALLHLGTQARGEEVKISSRPGVEVAVRFDEAAQRAVLGDLFDCGVRCGSVLTSKDVGSCTVVGVRGYTEVWYTQPQAQGSWYFLIDELAKLVSSGAYSVEQATAASHPTPPPCIGDDQFIDLASDSWSRAEDEALVALASRLSGELGVDPCRIPASLLESGYAAVGAQQSRSSSAVQARYCVLCALSEAAELVLPFTDVGSAAADYVRVSLLTTQGSQEGPWAIQQLGTTTSSSGSAYRAIKTLVFSRVKLRFWSAVVAETATATSEPPDQYDRPDDIREISINRILARSTERPAMQGSEYYALRLHRSVFGQLKEAFDRWDERSLRRSFTHMQDAGQARAFYVKLLGEGGDDNGGPYRAVFVNALAEEAGPLLELLVPTPNAVAAVGQSQDRMMLNPSFSSSETRLRLYSHLGRLMGLASRHDILVPVSLATVIFRSLAGEVAGRADLQAMDSGLSNILRDISSGKAPGDEATELLQQALQACCPQRLQQRLLDSVPRGSVLEPEAALKICALVEHLVLSGQQLPLERLYTGLSAVLPVELFAVFTAEELERLLCGQVGIDIAVLKKATVYEGVEPSDEHIKMFWDVVEGMGMEERSQLINFCSGRSRLPASAEDFPMRFRLTAPPPQSSADPDAYLPKSQTCFFSLSLPKYTSAQVCKQKLQYAIRNADLIDSDFVVRNAAGWEHTG